MNGIAIAEAEAPCDDVPDPPGVSAHTHSSAPSGSTTLPVSAEGVFLSEEHAQTVFDTLRSDTSYVWEYREDGCLARAHKMCRFLTRRGIRAEKIWIENANGTWLRPFGLVVLPEESPEESPGEPVHLHFHAAVVVLLQTAAGVEERIMDPTFFGGPVPQAMWSKKFINAESISITKQIDYGAQEKDFRRFPHDVFDTTLCWSNKDPDMALTDKTLASLKGSMAFNNRSKQRILLGKLQQQG